MKQKEYELARDVLKLANTIITNRNKHIKELNLTAEQADSLQFFYAHDRATSTDLKQYLGISHQTARGIVMRLSEKGFIHIAVSDKDSRCRIVSLTDAGKKILQQLQENGTHTGNRILNNMTEEEQAVFSRLIKRALKNVTG